MVLIAHSVEGSISAQGWIYTGVWCAVAVGLVAADRSAWRQPAPGPGRRPPILLAERTP